MASQFSFSTCSHAISAIQKNPQIYANQLVEIYSINMNLQDIIYLQYFLDGMQHPEQGKVRFKLSGTWSWERLATLSNYPMDDQALNILHRWLAHGNLLGESFQFLQEQCKRKYTLVGQLHNISELVPIEGFGDFPVKKYPLVEIPVNSCYYLDIAESLKQRKKIVWTQQVLQVSDIPGEKHFLERRSKTRFGSGRIDNLCLPEFKVGKILKVENELLPFQVALF